MIHSLDHEIKKVASIIEAYEYEEARAMLRPLFVGLACRSRDSFFNYPSH